MSCGAVNWDAVSAVGTLAGAIATFVAVFVALFQAKIANRKKLKLSFSDNHMVIETTNRSKESGPYLWVSAVNIGNRDVTIQNWFIQVNKNLSYFVKSNMDLPFMARLPAKIRPEDKIDLAILLKDLIEILQKDKERNSLNMNEKLRVVLYDTAGKAYKIESKRTLREYLEVGGDS